MQTAMTLLFGSASDAQVPCLGASGAIAAVLGAYFVLYPSSRIPRSWGGSRSNPGMAVPRRLVSVPVLRKQLRAGPGKAVAVVSHSLRTSEDSPSGRS